MNSHFDILSSIEEMEKNSCEVSGWDYDFEEPIDEDRLFDDELSYLYN